MLNIPDLEKRWLRYKIRSYLPATLVALFLIFGVIIYTVLDFTPQQKEDNTNVIAIQKKQILKPIEVKQIEQNRTIQQNNKTIALPKKVALPKKSDTNTTILSPSMNFINTIEHSSTQTQPIISSTKKSHKVKKVVKKQQKIIKQHPVSTITITKQDTAKDIQNILKRFKEDRNPALSLFLAKKYYELGEYEQASKYALITNKLNKEIEDSWLIFAKALVKMHHKDKAINILRHYIKSSHSVNATVLLHDIQSGEFQ